ncbi:MAG: hypothetical protein L6Q92_03910 [Phycisphaerae bacterium]|nr:hypothetical protein [Phycisphaerae bacterium]
MAGDPDYLLDLSSGSAGGPDGPDASESTPPARRWIGVHFECCGVYARIYRLPSGTAYEGFCPRCARRVRVRVDADGTEARFFRAR